MNPLTQIFVWIEERLDKGAWARRAYVVIATCFTWNVMAWSEHYAEVALVAKMDGLSTAAVIAAVSATAGVIQTFAFKHYLDSREGA
jgi:hypothetical protein